MSFNTPASPKKRKNTWEGAKERLLPRMASHMRPQGVSARMRHTLPRTAIPLTRILLLPRTNMHVMYMRDQPIHIVQIAHGAAFPSTSRDLLVASVVFEHLRDAGRAAGDVAGGIGGDVGLGVVFVVVVFDGVGVGAASVVGCSHSLPLGRRHAGGVVQVVEAHVVVFDFELFGEVLRGERAKGRRRR